MKSIMKIAIIMPRISQFGGVISYYRSVLPYIEQERNLDAACFYVGSEFNKISLFHPFTDQLRFITFLNREKPDLVHVNPSLNFKSFIRDGLLIRQAKSRNLPVLVFFRGWQISFESVIEKKLKWFFDRTYLKADNFMVLASDFKKKLRQWGVKSDIFPGTTTVDYNLTKDFSIQDVLKIPQKKDEIKILFLSRIEKTKGIFETIDAFKLLINKKYNMHLSIAGDGPDLKKVKKYVKKKNIPESRLTFLGYVSGDEKIKSFKEHDIYCFPTYDEGMPNSVLEAMAFGMPIVTRPVGGIKDFFQNGKMGFLFESKSPDKIADLIEKLICDKNLFANIRRFNYTYAKDNFMAATVAKKLIKTYQTILPH